jgi:hypothetical protein
MTKPWFMSVKRSYLLDFQMPDSADQMPIGQARNLRDIDPERIVAQLHDAGVQALYTHAKDNQGNCYYDTRFGHKHSGIGERDLMAEFSSACRERGMAILYYVQLSRERRGSLEESYAARDESGERVVLRSNYPLQPSKDERPIICLNGPGRDYMHNILRELSEGYDFDGYWLDCFAWWARVNPCYCEVCRAKYAEDVGAPLPAAGDRSSPAWTRYLRWRHRLNTHILHELVSTIRRANPALSVTHNGTGCNFEFYTDARIADADDYVSHEFHYNDGYGNLALWCRKNAALKPGVPFEVETWRFFNLGLERMVRGYQVRPVAQLFTEMATILANGGFIQYYDQIRPDGTLDGLSLERMRAAFEQVAAREPYLQGQTRLDYAALLWSKPTDAFAYGPHAGAHQRELEGFHYAFMEKHLPHTVITERALAAGDFGAPKVVVLPNALCLGEGEAEALRAFVHAGGGLVATYRSSLADAQGSPRDNFLLADLFGADFLEPMSYTYSYLHFDEEHPLTSEVPLGWPMTLWNLLQLKVRTHETATGLGNLVNPTRGLHMGNPPQETLPYPAAVTRRYGEGRVVYFPQPLGECYGAYGHPDTRQLMVNAARWAAGEAPAIETRAPETVETVVWQAGDTWRVHLVNRTAGGPARTKASVITEVIPVHDVRLGTSLPISEARLQPGDDPLEVQEVNGRQEVRVPKLEVHAVVVLK